MPQIMMLLQHGLPVFSKKRPLMFLASQQNKKCFFVSSYKPVDIMISAGMVDIVMEDMNGNIYHIEEQRNMTEGDLCRFAVYYFSFFCI